MEPDRTLAQDIEFIKRPNSLYVLTAAGLVGAASLACADEIAARIPRAA